MRANITKIFMISHGGAGATTLIFIFLMLSVLNCRNPFATRNPEPPETPKPTSWKQPTQASDVLDNLRNAIQDENVINYLNCFTDKPVNGRSFGFLPDQNARIRYPGIWKDWGLAQEQTYIANVFQFIPGDSLPSLIFLGEGI